MTPTKTKSAPSRLIQRMRRGFRSSFVVVLAVALGTSALACPLRVASMNRQGMPCSRQDTRESCPVSICQLSVPYVATHVSIDAPVLPEHPVSTVAVAIPGYLPGEGNLIQREEGPPPGPNVALFLRFRSLLI